MKRQEVMNSALTLGLDGRATPVLREYPQGGNTSSQVFRVMHKISAIAPLHAG
jgi:hypothetical protein